MGSTDGAPGFFSAGGAFGNANDAYFAGEPIHQKKGS